MEEIPGSPFLLRFHLLKQMTFIIILAELKRKGNVALVIFKCNVRVQSNRYKHVSLIAFHCTLSKIQIYL